MKKILMFCIGYFCCLERKFYQINHENISSGWLGSLSVKATLFLFHLKLSTGTDIRNLWWVQTGVDLLSFNPLYMVTVTVNPSATLA